MNESVLRMQSAVHEAGSAVRQLRASAWSDDVAHALIDPAHRKLDESGSAWAPAERALMDRVRGCPKCAPGEGCPPLRHVLTPEEMLLADGHTPDGVG